MLRTQIRANVSSEAARKGGLAARMLTEQYGPPHIFLTISMCEFKSPTFYENLMQFYEYQEPIFDNPDIKSFGTKAFKMK